MATFRRKNASGIIGDERLDSMLLMDAGHKDLKKENRPGGGGGASNGGKGVALSLSGASRPLGDSLGAGVPENLCRTTRSRSGLNDIRL